MAYTIERMIEGAEFGDVEKRTREALAAQGFGVLTEIDVAATLKAKLGETMEGYKILGACNPGYAHRALDMDRNLGALLPCNVVVRQMGGGVLVFAMDPVEAFRITDTPELVEVAEPVRDKIQAALDAI